MVAKYPVEISDSEGIVDAVNYLMSGPAGLGQNFNGFSASQLSYLRFSTKQPWSLPGSSTLNGECYLSRPINNITIVGGNPSSLITCTFTTSFADVPFQFGDRLNIFNVTQSGSDTSYNNINFLVYSCTTTDVTIGLEDFPSVTWNSYISGGTIGRNFMDIAENNTDCNATVTVQGPTDKVFISSTFNMKYGYVCNTVSDYDVVFTITRYKGSPSKTPGSSEYVFGDGVAITRQLIAKTPAGIGFFQDTAEINFSTILDGPNLDFGYYLYVLQVGFNSEGVLDPATAGPDFTTKDLLFITGSKPVLGSTTTYSSISPITDVGVGSGCVVDVTLHPSVSGAQYVYSTVTVPNTDITITNPGSGYKVGDRLIILGTSLGGTSPTNDMTLRVIYVTPPYDIEVKTVETNLRSLTAQVIKE